MNAFEQLSSRYSKQIKVHTIGDGGQRLISEASCAIIGLGALGSSVADQLARAGIGHLRIIDRDFVELSNIQRQSLYVERDAEQFVPKAIAAADYLHSINSLITIEPIIADVQASNINTLLDGCNIIVDCSDNFTIRYLINDYCTYANKPWIYGAVVGTSGSTTTFIPGESACFRCLFPQPPELGTVDTCDTAGVLAPIVNMIASLQVVEVIKLATGQIDAVNQKLIQLDCWQPQLFKIDLTQAKVPDCPCCIKHEFTWLTKSTTASSVHICGRNTIQLTLDYELPYSIAELNQIFAKQYKVKNNRYLLKVQVNDEINVIFFPDQRIMIQGTEDVDYAVTFFNKLIQI